MGKDIVNILKRVDALEKLIFSSDAEQKEIVNTPQEIVPFQFMFQDKNTTNVNINLDVLLYPYSFGSNIYTARAGGDYNYGMLVS